MTPLAATIAGIGYWSEGLPGWAAARAFANTGTLPADAPARPAPQLLPPNERRRAPPSVLVALEVAQAACRDAGLAPDSLPSVFISTHGDLGITDYMCTTLAQAPTEVSPTKFHNSVHNAAAGYWTIGTGCMRTTTAISAHRASFAQGLLEALAQLATDADAVLLVGYDTWATGLLSTMTHSEGLLGAALVLARTGPGPRITATLEEGEAGAGDGPLAMRGHANAMAPMLPLFDALACGRDRVALHAGAGRHLQLDIAHG
ncbi:beta-ketoacyl synthase chain length factor [Luteimonas wenzhouensis]|uniref:Beta-ketoacyl synthase chain length factor n=1 Tax=Luteimonas wenzhouensis TaxID=2599615 RepID=A0A5C5TZC6_9GAMM|nr:beta-ketoacyl synthase chain length factor [Luteimonas wenzhouensis]TWT19491.1 beta-ketoacyl synthase chain length factor [Luteimonas wenzhouensis]